MPWPIPKEFLQSITLAEEMPVFWTTLNLCGNCHGPVNATTNIDNSNSNSNDDNDTAIRCTECHVVQYCSLSCQKEHEHEHTNVCDKLSKIQFDEWKTLDLKGPELTFKKEQEEEDCCEEDMTTTTTTTTINDETKQVLQNLSSENIMILTQQCLLSNSNEFDTTEVSYLFESTTKNKNNSNSNSNNNNNEKSALSIPPQTQQEAQELLEQIAKIGNRDAQFGMALLCTKRSKMKQIQKQKEKEKEKESNNNNDDNDDGTTAAINNTNDDIDIDIDANRALYWTKCAAYNNLPDAQIRYAKLYWFNGQNNHIIDFIQAILWIRNAIHEQALIDNTCITTIPTFVDAISLCRNMSTKYYNTINQLSMKYRDISYQREMFLLANCGIISAINLVWLVHSKGNWYINFFQQIEKEKEKQKKGQEEEEEQNNIHIKT